MINIETLTKEKKTAPSDFLIVRRYSKGYWRLLRIIIFGKEEKQSPQIHWVR